MTHPGWQGHPPEVSAQEFEAILATRRQVMHEAAQDASCSVPKELMDRWGYKGRWKLLGRDRVGNPLLLFTILDPNGMVAYRRHVRLVNRAHLPYRLGSM